MRALPLRAPVLEVAYQQYHAQGVDFLGDDVGDTTTNALSFVDFEHIGYPSINDPAYSVDQRFSQAAPVSDGELAALRHDAAHLSSDGAWAGDRCQRPAGG